MRRLLTTLQVWFDSWAVEVDLDDPDAHGVDWLRALPCWLGLIWRLTPVPEKARRSGLVADGAGR